MQEAVHDIKTLGTVMDMNEYTGQSGHSNYIYNNFAIFANGLMGGEIKSNISSASVLCHPYKDVFDNLNLLNTTWATYGNCTKTGTQDKVVLSSPGTADPCGIAAQFIAEEGNIIYIRVGVRLVSGNTTGFSLGSDNITNGAIKGDTKTFKLPQNGSIIYLDKRLYCQHREPVNINIDVNRLPTTLQAATVELSSIEIKYMTEDNVSVQSGNLQLKPSINLMNDKVQSIVNKI